MNRQRLLLAGLLMASLAIVAAACGDETTRIENTGNEVVRGITVSGEGKVTAKPDLANLQLGVSVLAPTVADARNRAATSMEAIINSMKGNGVADKDIQTTQIYISPEYDYTSNSGQILRGFRVTNTVSAKVRNIDSTSKVVDDAVDAGGNDTQIQGISFTIDKPETLQDDAREQAVADARARAETLARAGGVDLGDPIAIVEGGASAPPIPLAAGGARLAEDQAATPIQTGELDVAVSVTVTWAIK